MDEFFLQLSELARAGWSFEIHPQSSDPTLPAVHAVILWAYEREVIEPSGDRPAQFPLIDWINLFAPELELPRAVAKMHARIFPLPPYGNIAA